jgi:5'-3' exonuclease
MKYYIVDTANLFFKSRYVASRQSNDWERIGMAIYLTLASVNSLVRKYSDGQPAHVVFALEGRSWRKDFYKPYKANRDEAKAALTDEEIATDRMYWDAYEQFTKFLIEQTNVSVLRCPTAEGDDIIARFIALHPDDEHIIVSSDGDFYQLIASNVRQYNSLNNTMITDAGIYDERGRKVAFTIDSKCKIKIGKPDANFIAPENWVEYALFLKCIRGDDGDNVFSAYPGVRERGTKNKTGLKEAFDDRLRKGFAWNNLMLQRWTDHNSEEHKVLTDYERNRILIDLKQQPEGIKQAIDACVISGLKKERVSTVGINLLKFCGKFELVRISDNPDSYARWMNNSYAGVLVC